MKKIALLYLNVKNYGDVVIHDTCKYLVNKYLIANKAIDAEILDLDIGDYKLDKLNVTNKRKIFNFIINRYIDLLKIFKFDSVNIKKHIRRLEYKTSLQYLAIKYRTIKKLNECDVIVFCGGGLIKYHKQEFHMIIDHITNYADKHNIPVLFNAVGIEGYEEDNFECMILKNALNRKCVKSISTRDDIDTLNKKYIVNKSIKTKLIADPAVWSRETYKISNKDSNVIGVGVIRPLIFKDYLYDVSEDDLIKLYSDIVTKLRNKKYEVKLFTNGALRDQEFAYKIQKFMNEENLVEIRPANAHDLIENINKYKGVIGTRLHSNIISYALNKPTVGIVWNIKQIFFSKVNDIEEYFITKENFNANYIVNKMIKAINKQKKIEQKYKQSSYKFISSELDKILKD